MTTLDRLFISFMVILLAISIRSIEYSARESHRHLHQIGCHVGVEDDCRWIEDERHD